MTWQGIERNRLDYILTDLLPVELSELVSFEPLYSFLMEDEQQKIILDIVAELKRHKAKGNGRLFEGNWSTMPLKYNILKGADSTREMSIMQPLSALNLYFFIEIYQNDILNFFEKKHCFSIRFHKKNTYLYYKGKTKKRINYFHRQATHIGKNVIQQTGCYFKIAPFESINTFNSSRIWRNCNFKYKYYAKIDYKACFDSIYTHAYKWIIERNVVDSKKARNSHLLITIDRVLENINGRSSNGVIVGPEFSRMIAEILLQQIDNEVMNELSCCGLTKDRDYSVYRYVDDIFLFANQNEDIDKIISKYRIIGGKYLLRLNELKLKKDKTPCLPKEWIEKTRELSDEVANFFFHGSKAEYNNLPDDKKFIVKKDRISVDRIKDETAILMKMHFDERRTIVSFLLSTFLNNIKKKNEGYTLFGEKGLGKALLILDLAFFIYAFYPSFDQTRKILSLISYMNDEMDFKNNNDAHKKLSRLIDRYAFVFQTGNMYDLCDWFPFLLEYNIFFDKKTEEIITAKVDEYNNPILWANLLLYSRYYKPFHDTTKVKVESIIDEQLSKISGKEELLQLEIWYVFIFHNCPYISEEMKNKLSDMINNIRPNLSGKSVNKSNLSEYANKLVCDFLQRQSKNGQKPEKSLFNWKGEKNFSENITYRTYQRTIFKGYRKNKYSLYASLD